MFKGLLFKLASDGQLYFNERAKKHSGALVQQVIREDPKYVQWARRDGTFGAAQELTDKLDDVFITNSVPYVEPRKKKP